MTTSTTGGAVTGRPVARNRSMSTEEIKARIEAMFARDGTEPGGPAAPARLSEPTAFGIRHSNGAGRGYR